MFTAIDVAYKTSNMSSTSFLTLEQILDCELGKLPINKHFKNLNLFLNNDNDCAEFINILAAENIMHIPPNGDNIFKISKKRAQHTVLTYLLGLAFLQFAEQFIFSSSSDNADLERKEFLEDWRVTAIYHDIGYFNKHITDSAYDLREDVTYWLLTDSYTNVRNKSLECLNGFYCNFPSIFAYKYKEIESYDKYSRERRRRKYINRTDVEFIDHGILGATSSFNMLVSRIKSDQGSLDHDHALIRTKKACMTIAQHNIYKSDSVTDDANLPDILRPKLASTSSFRISRNTPLLLFLSLVDTIECVKKFSKGKLGDRYFQALSVLRYVKMSISRDKIILDLSELKAEWDKKTAESDDDKLKENFGNYYNGIIGLPKWTEFNVSADDTRENILTISLSDKELSHV